MVEVICSTIESIIGWCKVSSLVECLELLYYVAFVILTVILVKYAIRTFKVTSKKESVLISKFILDDSYIVFEVYNYGNIIAKEVEIKICSTEMLIPYIKPLEVMRFVVGTMFVNGKFETFYESETLDVFIQTEGKIVENKNYSIEEIESQVAMNWSSENNALKQISKSIDSLKRY